MKGRPWLLLLLVASVATISYSKTLTPIDDVAETNNVLADHEKILKDSKIPMAADPSLNKMLPESPYNPEFVTDPNIPMAEDPRFNKMLPENIPTIAPSIPMASNPRLNKMVPRNDKMKVDPNIPMASDPRFNKMLPMPPKIIIDDESVFNKPQVEDLVSEKKATTESLGINKMVPNMKVDPNIPMASDPRFNKMLQMPPKVIIDDESVFNKPQVEDLDSEKKATTEAPGKKATTIPFKTTKASKIPVEEENRIKDDANHSEYGKDDDYSQYYDYDEKEYDDDEIEPLQKSKKNDEKLIPVKNNKLAHSTTTPSDEEEDYSEEDEDDDIIDETFVKNSNSDDNIPCPRDCVCERNMNHYMVATCNRLDPEIQKFGSSITDLQVLDVEQKYPMVLGDEFFAKIGLKNIVSIKISNCTIEDISPTAFKGLDKLYSVNLTNTGIELIHPDTFAGNNILKLLTLSGNNLSAMQRADSPYKKYMIKSPSIEELDISYCNLENMLPTAFVELKQVVFINLAGNVLQTLPETIFNKVETIEELDLSYNSIADLPEKIFNKTSLAILHLKYNEISSSLKFVTRDLQTLELSYCKIGNINGDLFKGMEGLTNLNLKGNGIRKIHPAAFMSMKALRHIDLSFNSLLEIPSVVFAYNCDLDVIKLNDNRELTKLPLEGFECSGSGSFSTYFIDISNCDISDIGVNTFATMPALTRLNLSWNNIVNLDKTVFRYLNKLIDLDLSNNLIEKLPDKLFAQNKNLNKLSLAGNPIEELSSKVFIPTAKLSELDLSDCDLLSIWSDSTPKLRAAKVLKNLRVLNVSNNEILSINQADLEIMSNLKVLDITNNQLTCDQTFLNLMKWLGKKQIRTSSLGKSAKQVDSFFVEDNFEYTWDSLAKKVCKHDTEITESKHNNVVDSDLEIVKNVDDIEEEDDDEYDDEDYEDEEQEQDIYGVEKKNNKQFTDEGILVSEVIQKTQNAILTEFDDSDDESIIYVKSGSLYSKYGFVVPMLIVVFTVIVLLLVIAKGISCMMRKRGERYRQALLASKNSIVYQKLSEEIAGPQTPKLNRYQPINQV